MENSFIRVEALSLVFGMTHNGFRHMCLPMDIEDRGHVCFLADREVHLEGTMQEELQYMPLEDIIVPDGMEGIRKGRMREPAPEKYAYYENYYLNTKKLCHPIIVDSRMHIVSGYVSYLLVQKYGAEAKVCRISQELPVQKIVKCALTERENGNFRVIAERGNRWIYGLEAPVMPGEILLVRTEQEEQYLCVEDIEYVTGKELLRDTWD